MLSKWHW
jgi:hypothetical protein